MLFTSQLKCFLNHVFCKLFLFTMVAAPPTFHLGLFQFWNTRSSHCLNYICWVCFYQRCLLAIIGCNHDVFLLLCTFGYLSPTFVKGKYRYRSEVIISWRFSRRSPHCILRGSWMNFTEYNSFCTTRPSTVVSDGFQTSSVTEAPVAPTIGNVRDKLKDPKLVPSSCSHLFPAMMPPLYCPVKGNTKVPKNEMSLKVPIFARALNERSINCFNFTFFIVWKE